jgi:glycosyltransferase involved in cell wall biosynthesis
MRIAQIAPLMERVPPRLYGGTERIVFYLTEELVRQGHNVTLFATADSVTSAELVACAQGALRLDPNVRDPVPYYMLMLDRVCARAAEFDILHFHIDAYHFPLFRDLAGRTVTTLHGRQDLFDLHPLYLGFGDMPLVSISEAQRKPIPNANFLATIHHGLPLDSHRPIHEPRGGYVAFVGRISPEKRPDRAIEIARPWRAIEDRRQGRPCRRALFPRNDRAAAWRPRDRVHEGDRRTPEDGSAQRSVGAAVPD